MSSFKAKSLTGLTWSFVDNFAGSLISFVVGIVLARLLDPATFGIVGMVALLFALSNAIIDSGFTDGLIRKVRCTHKEYSTVFIFNIGISIILYLILYFSAPYVALFFKEPILIKVVQVLGLVVIIDSFSLVQRIILIREINFKLQTKISIFASITSGIVGISMAYIGLGVWSLITQILIKQSITGLLLWVFSKWRPGFIFSLPDFKELFSFSSKLLGMSIINMLQNNIFYLVIGRYFSAAGLGYYTRAEQFNAIFTSNLNGAMQRVFLPVFSSIQEDEIRLKSSFKKVIITSSFITFMLLFTMVAIAKPFILILIGSKWQTSILYLQLLSIGSFFFPLSTLNFNILKLKGRSDLILKIQFIKVILTTIVIICGILGGITIMLVARIFTVMLETILNGMFSGKLINYSLKEQFKDIFPYFVPIIIIGLIMLSLSFTSLSPWAMIIIQISTGFVLFFVSFEYKKYHEYLEVKKMIIGLLSS